MPQNTSTFISYANIGTEPVLNTIGTHLAYANIGDALPPLSSAAVFIAQENVGVTLYPQTEPGVAYENVVPKPPFVGWGYPVKL